MNQELKHLREMLALIKEMREKVPGLDSFADTMEVEECWWYETRTMMKAFEQQIMHLFEQISVMSRSDFTDAMNAFHRDFAEFKARLRREAYLLVSSSSSVEGAGHG